MHEIQRAENDLARVPVPAQMAQFHNWSEHKSLIVIVRRPSGSNGITYR
jgi:hypothetical protein